jgi:two-component system, NarL family, response regulator DevR
VDPAPSARRRSSRLGPGSSRGRQLSGRRGGQLQGGEERILELVAAGRTNKQIGEELHLAEKTVKNYVSSILAKLEVTRRAEAASYLTRHTTTPGS